MSTDDLAPENFVDPAAGNADAIRDLNDTLDDGDEVMEEDLGTQDLIDDGADAADMTPDDLQVAVDRTLHVDEPGEETIAQRIAQEEPDVQP
ncbi:MAG TPA: hypothetical protein GX013_06930 [Propionibacterium sp.]|nr:hypothetical protein [Propionibacterium sp.]